VASIHAQNNSRGKTYRVLWRADGRQRSLTFENLPSAERFKTLVEDHGPDEALRVIELDEIGKHVPTVTEWLNIHIDNLTGVQPATLNRYRTYVTRDVDPVFGSLPISAVTETTIARWVNQLDGSGKTISNKHGFVSGAFNAAVRAGVMATNPCVGRRLPHTRVEETVFLTPAEFKLLRDHIERERWKNLATWLVTTGMRFSEATALTPSDIDAEARTCRINKAWKYSGDYRPEIGPPKMVMRSEPSSVSGVFGALANRVRRLAIDHRPSPPRSLSKRFTMTISVTRGSATYVRRLAAVRGV
jgi:integrase